MFTRLSGARLIFAFKIFKTLSIPNRKGWVPKILRECSTPTMCHVGFTWFIWYNHRSYRKQKQKTSSRNSLVDCPRKLKSLSQGRGNISGGGRGWSWRPDLSKEIIVFYSPCQILQISYINGQQRHISQW